MNIFKWTCKIYTRKQCLCVYKFSVTSKHTCGKMESFVRARQCHIPDGSEWILCIYSIKAILYRVYLVIPFQTHFHPSLFLLLFLCFRHLIQSRRIRICIHLVWFYYYFIPWLACVRWLRVDWLALFLSTSISCNHSWSTLGLLSYSFVFFDL